MGVEKLRSLLTFCLFGIFFHQIQNDDHCDSDDDDDDDDKDVDNNDAA